MSRFILNKLTCTDISRSFRNRVLSAAEDPQEFVLTPGLEIKVATDSYQLKFVANTE